MAVWMIDKWLLTVMYVDHNGHGNDDYAETYDSEEQARHAARDIISNGLLIAGVHGPDRMPGGPPEDSPTYELFAPSRIVSVSWFQVWASDEDHDEDLWRSYVQERKVLTCDTS